MKLNGLAYFKYCPRCSGKLLIKKQEGVKRLVCKKCNFVFYQNSKPTASAFFTNQKGQIMLVKRNIKPKFGYWDAPGGFLEEGEDPIVGLKREMKEELGVSIHNIKYLGVYIDWYECGYNMSTLNIIYSAMIKFGEPRPMSDVGEIKWFDKGKIPWPKLAFPRWMRPALKDWIKIKKAHK